MLPPRVKTGIPGLDPLIEGGLLQSSVTLVTGATGTGKTLFCAQYLWAGLEMGEPGVFLTLEETAEDIKADAQIFGWDFDKYEKKGMFKILYHDPVQVANLSSVVIGEVSDINAKRLVIDSTAVLGMMIDDQAQLRRRLYNIINTIKQHGKSTALLTSEIPEGQVALSRFGVEEFVADSVIMLNYLPTGEGASRTLLVRKMRRTNHEKDICPLEITKKGLQVKRSQI